MLEARTALHARLTEVLGDVPAATLMSYLPGDHPATSTDLTDLRAGLDSRMDRIEARMDRIEDRMERLESRMGDLSERFHTELRAQTRTFVVASLGSSATIAAVVVAAASIL